MKILNIDVSGFRNLAENRYVFSPSVNLVLGRNGEGKTNFLEALAFFALGRSHRGARAEDLIGFDADALHVKLELAEAAGSTVVCEFGLDRHGERRFRIDGQTVKRRADLVGRLITVFFNPDSIQLVRGGPSTRRQFVDQSAAELDPLYLAHLSSLQRVVRQKSSLLKDIRKRVIDPAAGRRELQAWNRELSVHAAEVVLGRRDYARRLVGPAGDVYNALTDNNLEFHFEYRPKLDCIRRIPTDSAAEDFDKGDLAEEIRREIDYIMETEIGSGRLLTGPQLDDFEVRHDGLDLRVFGSQGETRSAAIALIMGRSDVLFQQRRVRPVLFFDDIFSELDRERTRRLQEMATQDHQVFIATARDDDVQGWQPADLSVWRVTAGVLTRE